jgi:hypothetical protein
MIQFKNLSRFRLLIQIHPMYWQYRSNHLSHILTICVPDLFLFWSSSLFERIWIRFWIIFFSAVIFKKKKKKYFFIYSVLLIRIQDQVLFSPLDQGTELTESWYQPIFLRAWEQFTTIYRIPDLVLSYPRSRIQEPPKLLLNSQKYDL